MSEIEWVKLAISLFDNRKIKHLRRLTDGDSIVLFWVALLVVAGRCNSCGVIFFTKNVPYTPKMLADELGFEESTVKLALSSFEQLDMIYSTDEGFICVTDWEEHQNIDGMDKVRELNRQRKQRQREKQRLLSASNVDNTVSRDSHVTVTQCHATEEDKELRNKNIIYADEPPKKGRKFVPPTVEEVQQYISEKNLSVNAEDFVSYFEAGNWHDSKGQAVRNWKQKILTWSRGSFGQLRAAPNYEPEMKGIEHF